MNSCIRRSDVVLLTELTKQISKKLYASVREAVDMVYELIPDDMTFMRLPSYGLPSVFDESHSDLRCSFFNSSWWDEEHISRLEEAGGQTVDLKHTLQLALMQSDAEKLFRQVVDEFERPEKEMKLAYEEFRSRRNTTKNRPVFFDDLSGLITTAKIISKSRNVSLPEASDFLERTLVQDGTVIYTKVAGHQVDELGEAWYAPACDYVGEALGGKWWSRPDLLDEPLPPLGVLRDELAISNIDAVRLLDLVVDGEKGENTSRQVNSEELEITGDTFDRLKCAVSAFPTRYPDYQSQPPKLNDDVRLWLHQAGLVNDGQKGREAHVFGKIIAEHFKLLGDTLKTK